MEQVEVLIIGAGAVGLAVGYKLSELFEDVIIVEKEETYGRHTSSRNSEVIHSGIYYPQNSIKKELCIKGRKMLYKFLEEYKIPFRKCGKLVVASSQNDIPQLQKLYENGLANGVDDIEIISAEKCRELAPEVIASQAILVPQTGIMNTHKYMQQLKIQFEENDGFMLYDMEVTDITKTEEGYTVTFNNGEKFLTKILINCAGLHCEHVAQMAGVDTKANNLKIHWCKAEYYKTSETFELNKLIYPLPDPSGMYLGIHLTLNLAGEVRFGPSAYYIDELDYSMDESYKEDFISSVSSYLKLDTAKLHPDDTGIRPKLQGPEDGFRDFHIKEDLPGFINLMGIESPGLTASLAIGAYLYNILK